MSRGANRWTEYSGPKYQIRKWLEKHLGGHITIKFGWYRLTIYGFNAMHVALELNTHRWGYVCFHPPLQILGWDWPWYFYVSPNATPSCSTFAIGPGMDYNEKRTAKDRREMLGHNFDTDLIYDGPHRGLLG